MKPIAVLIPGMMGSSLEYSGYRGGTETLWGEDIYANYDRLIKQPGTLRWVGNRAEARLLKALFLAPPMPGIGVRFSWRKIDLWGALVEWLASHPSYDVNETIEFGYDWRAPLVESANELAGRLEVATTGAVLDESDGITPKFTFITHSMGGILVRVALGTGALLPGQIDRIIHIGSPLKGAPAAFRSAYDSAGLPFFQELFSFIRRKNTAAFQQNLLECIRTFPSLYCLLPTEEISYLFYSQSSRSNPLREKYMDEFCRGTAHEAHRLVAKSQELIEQHHIPTYAIYTAMHAGRRTELEYRVTPLGLGRGYAIDEIVARTIHGDGTVPSDSARGEGTVSALSVLDVEHAYMCNNVSVVECLNSVVPKVHEHDSQLQRG